MTPLLRKAYEVCCLRMRKFVHARPRATQASYIHVSVAIYTTLNFSWGFAPNKQAVRAVQPDISRITVKRFATEAEKGHSLTYVEILLPSCILPSYILHTSILYTSILPEFSSIHFHSSNLIYFHTSILQYFYSIC